MLPKILEDIARENESAGGWLTGLSNDLLKLNSNELIVCFPTFVGTVG